MIEKVQANFQFKNVFKTVDDWIKTKDEQLGAVGELENQIVDEKDEQIFRSAFRNFEQHVNSVFSSEKSTKEFLRGKSRQQQEYDSKFLNNVFSRSFEQTNIASAQSSLNLSSNLPPFQIKKSNIKSLKPVIQPAKISSKLSPDIFPPHTASELKRKQNEFSIQKLNQTQQQFKEQFVLPSEVKVLKFQKKFNKNCEDLCEVVMPDSKQKVIEYLRNTDENLQSIENDIFNKHFLSSKTLFNENNNSYLTQTLPQFNAHKQQHKWNVFTRSDLLDQQQPSQNSPLSLQDGLIPKRQQQKYLHQELDVKKNYLNYQNLFKLYDQASILRLYGMMKEELNKTTGFNLKLPLLSIQIINHLFHSTDNILYQTLSYVIQRYIFCFDLALIQSLNELNVEHQKQNQKYKLDFENKKYSFYELCNHLIQLANNLKQSHQNSQQDNNIKLQEQQQNIKILQSHNQQYQNDLSQVQLQCQQQFQQEKIQQQESIQNKNKEVKESQDEIALLKKQLKTQEGIFLQNETELKMQIKMLQSECSQNINSLQANINQLKSANYSQSNQMFIMQDSYATQLISIRTFKERIQDLESKISLITEENSRLNARAGTNFFELTPRPTFDSIDIVINPDTSFLQQESLLNKQNYVNFKQISTQKRVEDKAKQIQKHISELKQTYEDRINVLISQQQAIQITENKKKAKVVIKSQQNRIRDSSSRNYFQSSFVSRKSIVVDHHLNNSINNEDHKNSTDDKRNVLLGQPSHQ